MSGRRRFVGTIGRAGAVITLHDPYAGVDLEAEPEAVGDMADGAVIEVDRDARTITLLAAPGSALAAIWGIAFEAGMDPVFPDAVEAEAAAHLAAPGLDDPALEDREAVPFVTIDGPTARDLDQAIAVQRDGDGFLILYAIADAAYVAPPGSALFAEALRRGASFYLPGLSIPMLPRALSEGITSLNPDVLRRALLFELRVGPDGASRGTRVVRARIRSRAKLSFGQVQELYDDPGTSPLAGQDFTASLHAMRDVGLALMRESESRDVVRYRRSEIDVRLEELRFVVVDALRDAVELYNEQVSLLCNREGARLLLECGDDAVQPIYRVHPPPDPHRVEGLERTIDALVRAHGLPEETFAWGGPSSKTSLSTYLQRLPESGPGERVARAIHRQAVMVNLRSGYATHPSAHYGVGAEVYARFSSPMREVVGVFLHKEMLEMLGAAAAGARAGPPGEDVATRDAVVIAANRAKARQKMVTDRANALVLDQLLGADLAGPVEARPIRRATVMGMAAGKVHLQLDAPTIDVKLWVEDLAASLGLALREDDDGVRLLAVPAPPAGGETVVLRLGDAVDLRVAWRNERGRWILDLVPSSPGR